MCTYADLTKIVPNEHARLAFGISRIYSLKNKLNKNLESSKGKLSSGTSVCLSLKNSINLSISLVKQSMPLDTTKLIDSFLG